MKIKMNPMAMRIGALIAASFLIGASVASAGQAKTPTPAPAKAPAAAKPIDAQQLAVVDRALEFCGTIDPDSAKKLKDQIAELTKGANSDAVAQARSSDIYKTAYSTMDGFVGQIDPRNAKVACANTARHK